jgi:hypothetical protein
MQAAIKPRFNVVAADASYLNYIVLIPFESAE